MTQEGGRVPDEGDTSGQSAAPIEGAGGGRVCAEPGCQTQLSVYNQTERCWQHAEIAFPSHRGKRLRGDRA